MDRCANREALRAYENRVMKAELQAERELEFFHEDVDDMLDQIATLATRIHELGNRYETIESEYIKEKLEEMIQC